MHGNGVWGWEDGRPHSNTYGQRQIGWPLRQVHSDVTKLQNRPFIRCSGSIYRTDHGAEERGLLFTEWDPQIILDTMAEMRKINAYVRKYRERLKATRLYSCHITIDDWADSPLVSKSNTSPLIQLFTKGRHSQVSTTCLVQKWRLLNSAIRVNCHSLWIGRVISNLERKKALAEELGAAARSEENFLAMLDRATAPAYGFLYIVFGLKIRFFNCYKSEFKVRSLEHDSDSDEED